jgi:serine/threonine protein kinase
MRYFYIVMPFFPEGTLGQWWQQQRRAKAGPFSRPDPLPPQEVADVVQQAASALQYAHDQQIIHQYIHVSNFLVRSKQASSHLPDLLLADFVDVVIANFRIAKFPAALPFSISPFIAPEQLGGNVLPASDQYALASMAYQLLTGFPPFRGEVPISVMVQILQDQPQPPSTLQPHLPSDLTEKSVP